MVNIIKDFVPARLAKKVTGGGMNGKKNIVVHQTGNTSKGANAKMHARLQKNGNSRLASWHYQVDDKEAYQSFPHSAQCYQSGDGRGDGNMNSISIEMCVNSDADYLQTLRNGAALIRKIMQEENISILNVKQHNFFSGKNCPSQLRAGKDGVDWNKFIEMVKGQTTVTVKPSTSNKKSSATIAQEVLDGKWGVNPQRKRDLESAGYNYTEVQGIVNRIIGGQQTKPKPVTKSVDQLAQEVIDGKHGQGDARKKALGSQYSAVQARVNAILDGGKPQRKTVDQMAREVVAGKHGNGHAARQRSLGISNAEYQKVRARVNQLA